jgi:uncharacterized protein YggT (Ycf19 family)
MAALAAVLLLRAFIYWHIGTAIDWTPQLSLGAIAVSFRTDYFERALLFSLLSFLVTLGVFFLWLLVLSLVNKASAESDPVQKLIRMHLGWIERFPWPVKLILPFIIAGLLWLALSPLLTRWEIMPEPKPVAQRLEQAAVIGLSAYLPCKYLVGVLLGLYLVSSYVYLGSQWVWDFVNVTGRNLLIPLRLLPLRVAKIDLAPLIGIGAVFLLAELGERGLTALYARLPL